MKEQILLIVVKIIEKIVLDYLDDGKLNNSAK